MKKYSKIREIFNLLNALESIIYMLIDSGFLMKNDFKAIRKKLVKISTCDDLGSCLNLINELTIFTRNHTKLLLWNEKEIISHHIDVIKKSKINELVANKLDDKQKEIIIETINAFAMSILQELEYLKSELK